jgi:hypothetical protein
MEDSSASKSKSSKAGKVAPKAAASAKADGEKRPKKVPKSKPWTDEETKIATHASMARNSAAVAHLRSIAATYKETAEYIKMAGMNKAAKSIEALTEPFKVPSELLALDNVGKGTVERLHAFCLEYGTSPSVGGSTAVDENALSADDRKTIEDSDREVLIMLIREKAIKLEDVQRIRKDVSAADVEDEE